MKSGGFRSKPTPTHIIWVRGGARESGGKKRFDDRHFEKWANHVGLDFERETLVDHERADEPRMQHRVVFTWGQTDPETISLGEDEWSLGTQKTPRTFIEVDEAGLARIKGWSFETVLDVVDMRHKGPELLIETAEGEKKRLNGRKFVADPRAQQREGSKSGDG